MSIKINVTGATRVVLEATEGQTLRRVFLNNAKFAKDKRHEKLTFKDEKGKPVSLDRKITGDLKIIATAKEEAAATPAAATPNATASAAATPVATPAPTQVAGPTAVAAPKPLEDKAATVTVTLKGKLTGVASGEKGQTLGDILKAASINSVGTAFADGSGRTYPLTAKIESDVALSTSARVTGG